MAEKKALMLASVASMIDQFNIPNIRILQSLGYRVDVAADFTAPGTITAERAEELRKRLKESGVSVKNIGIPRSLHPKKLFRAYHKVKRLVMTEHYDLIHCHSPIGGVVCRMAAIRERRRGTRVIYTAHGFHFYKGAPLKNWLLYYPVEKLFSRWTDVLITINREDYKRAKKKFFAKKTVYVPGVGIDLKRFGHRRKESSREKLGISKNATVLLSVGELNENKNHASVIRALAEIPQVREGRILYFIVGCGKLREALQELNDTLGLSKQIVLTGYRSDIAEFYDAADLYVLPSVRNGGELFDAADVRDIREKLKRLLSEPKDRLADMGSYNRRKIASFDMETVGLAMEKAYGRPSEENGGVKPGAYPGAEHLLGVQRKNSLRAELKCRPDEQMILSVGELSRRKNHQIVIRALAELDADPDFAVSFQYYIIGEGELKEELRKLADASGLHGSVHFTGYRTDITELLQAADLFVFPSLQEGLPVALMEAVSCGLPVLCSRIRGNVDLIENENSLFDRNDVSELVCKLKRLFRIKTFSKYGMEQMVLDNYKKLNLCSLLKVSEKMRDIYQYEQKSISGKEHIS